MIQFFPNTTEQVEGATIEDARANAIAKLGDEGWEMVGISESFSLSEGSGRSSTVIYFKRAK